MTMAKYVPKELSGKVTLTRLNAEEVELQQAAHTVYAQANLKLQNSNRCGWKHVEETALFNAMMHDAMRYEPMGHPLERQANLLDIINYATMLYLRAEEYNYGTTKSTDAEA